MQDTADTGWRICPGPIGQQVADVGGFDAGCLVLIEQRFLPSGGFAFHRQAAVQAVQALLLKPGIPLKETSSRMICRGHSISHSLPIKASSVSSEAAIKTTSTPTAAMASMELPTETEMAMQRKGTLSLQSEWSRRGGAQGYQSYSLELASLSLIYFFSFFSFLSCVSSSFYIYSPSYLSSFSSHYPFLFFPLFLFSFCLS